MWHLWLFLVFPNIFPNANFPAKRLANNNGFKTEYLSIRTANPTVSYRNSYRYKGKIGNAEITMWLEADSVIGKPGKYDVLYCQGFYFYNQHRQMLTLRVKDFDPGKPLVLEESVIDREKDKLTVTGQFRAGGRVGKTLTGTWISADGKRKLPFSLQEDHTGAVSYQYVIWEVTGPVCRDGGAESGYNAIHGLDYLRIDLPANPKVEALLRKELGGPKPDAQMPAYLKALMRSAEYSCQESSNSILVKYNGDNIFSVEHHSSFHGYGAARFYHSFTGTNVNLLTGEKLLLKDLLKPGFPDDDAIPELNEEERPESLLQNDFTINPDGLLLYIKQGANVEEHFLSYQKIQHLIRPDGPLKVFLN